MEQYYLFFLVYSFLGWCMETILFSVKEKKFINRGFLNGPICPVYGLGMVIIIYFLEPYYNNILVLFVLGALLASLLEFITGFLLEKIFATRWWDYTNKKFNLHGYVCLENTIAWGLLCIVMIHTIQPLIMSYLEHFTNNFLHSFSIISALLLLIDIMITISNLVNLRNIIVNMNIVERTIKDFEEISEKYHSDLEAMLENRLSISDYLTKLSEDNEKRLTEIKTRVKKTREKISKPRKQLTRLYRNYHTIAKDKGHSFGSRLVKQDLDNKKKLD
ncbi:putative ABC transporter permease [Erysipelotrichaceae bacterium OttesenSCG-928-M19]|nr:putative ABC transporter permease [Erysipelotrichaceae bacterium OttesenSCG-928-M19]